VVQSKRYEAVFIHRAICIAGPAVLERLLRLLNRPVIFDFDDAIWMLHTSEANRMFGWLKFPKKTSAICRASTHIVVGNNFLADYAREFNQNVTVVPTSIDIDYYKPLVRKEPRNKVIVGWTGSSTSQTHLEWFAPVLRELMKERDFELRVVSNREPDMPCTPYTWRAWSPETEIKEIGQFDVGIMPMPDDKWSKGKCALKALQCMAMGAATVASRVGANCEVIRHGENGLLALTEEEWHSSLKALIDDASLRERLGHAGLRTVVENYSARACADRFAEIIRKVVQV
jgi:glycosyltransferase involved in cell wall biosynthesis